MPAALRACLNLPRGRDEGLGRGGGGRVKSKRAQEMALEKPEGDTGNIRYL